jgi:hypothetical protein
VGRNLRRCWRGVDDSGTSIRLVTSRETQQLSGSVRFKVGPVQRYRSFPCACNRFQCLARSDQFHRMGSDRIGAPSRAATTLEVRHSRLAGVISPLHSKPRGRAPLPVTADGNGPSRFAGWQRSCSSSVSWWVRRGVCRSGRGSPKGSGDVVAGLFLRHRKPRQDVSRLPQKTDLVESPQRH